MMLIQRPPPLPLDKLATQIILLLGPRGIYHSQTRHQAREAQAHGDNMRQLKAATAVAFKIA